MQVPEFTEDHPYWGTLRQSQILDPKFDAVNAIEKRHSPKHRAYLQTLYEDSSPTQGPERGDQKARGRRRKGMSVVGRSRASRAQEKRFGLADPIVWDAISRSLDQQRRLSSIIVPEEAGLNPIQELDIPSRTSSQRKALDRFTRQLGKYADVAKAAGKVPIMTPTESESKISYHTVQQLLPYQKEFQAAGLAVTSIEQSQGSPRKLRSKQAPMNYALKTTAVPLQMVSEYDGQDDDTDEQSCSTSGSFVEFTPADQLIQIFPSPKSKSKQEISSKEKRGIFPWLKKKPSSKDVHGIQQEQQQTRPSARDRRIQSRIKTIDPQHPQDCRGLRPRRTPHVRVANVTTPMTQSPKSTKPAVNITTPQMPPSGASPSSGAKQSGYRKRPVPMDLGANPGKPSEGHTGLRKRDVAIRRPPRPETIEEEEMEASPIHANQKTIQIYPLPKSSDAQALTPPTHKQIQQVSPHTTPSTVPSLPYPARFAVSRPSSLERALDEVSLQLEQMEREADRSTQLFTRPPTLIEKTNRTESHPSPRHSGHQDTENALPRWPRKNEEVIYVNRRMPSIQSPVPKRKLKIPSSPPSPKTRDPPAPPRKQRQSSSPEDKKLPTVPHTEAILNDLDIFFDYDDADINDRDVIKGLQVAIHAAADNAYDAFIRDKTGLRIRRFLADLRAVGEMQEENPTNKVAGDRHI
ncbi:uncharacterized protein F4822DRAFT_79554 [Hypoxylon trugodes]|uniref:uncharacterized protein n=1 Tax=Hypoxylon trugodes TaxID=326681 RepID=UPI0021A22773|nr:uncharacterized protein F4822DRAFT_79554 [Hypoxylon trugodes]KAI1383502.1 hypothetical protein F4822DRAFT_79554 [Hypoxylon trugodes]